MRRPSMFALTCLLVAAVVGLPLLAGDAAAFQRGPWIPFGFVNVAAAEARFYDDMPAGVPGALGYEAGVIMMSQNQNVPEVVNYSTTSGLAFPATSPYKILEVKAAVSDLAWLRVGFGTSAAQPCQVYPAALNWVAGTANGQYFVRSAAITVPMNNLKKICIGLKDNPAAVAAGRANAMIDYIRLKSSTGATGWLEAFTGAP